MKFRYGINAQSGLLDATYFVGLILVFQSLAGCSSGTKELPEERTPQGQSQRWFQDQREAMGVDFVFESGHQAEFLFPEIVGGGAGFIDFDNDGYIDLYLAQGGSLATPNPQFKNQMYRNLLGKRMVNVSGPTGTADTAYSMGVAIGDFDSDGFSDIYVSNVGRNRLFRNSGDGTFEDVTDLAGVGDLSWGTSVAFLDVNGDRHLDLYVCNYVDWSLDEDVKCFKSTGQSDYCSPQSYNKPAQDVLFINQANGLFSDETRSSGIAMTPGNGLGVVVSDVNGDGMVDIFVANDMSNNHLWINDGGGHFRNQAVVAGCAVDRDGQVKAGMGTCVADISRNDRPDIFVVNLVGQTDSLFENRGKFFADSTPQRGLAQHSRKYTRFGVGFHDFDLNGDLDLFIACGRVTLPDRSVLGDPFAEPNLVLRGSASGTFTPLSLEEQGDAGLLATSRAAVFGDIDNDGRTDIVVVNRDAQVHILMNECELSGNWIGLDLRDTSGRGLVGAVVHADVGGRRFRREVNPHYSYLASNDYRVIFPMGELEELSALTVSWAGQEYKMTGPFLANRYHLIRLPSEQLGR